jgi:hypothetical protein
MDVLLDVTDGCLKEVMGETTECACGGQFLANFRNCCVLRIAPSDALVAKLGPRGGAQKQIIPVNYRLGAGHRLFFKTAPGGALAQLAEGDAQVAFEVDYHAADFRIAWSVLMNGMISRLDAAATAAYADLRLTAVPWPGPASSVLVQFMPRTVSGRSVLRASTD